MQYILLLYESEDKISVLSEEDKKERAREYFAFTDEMKATKKFVAGDGLQPTSTSKTIQKKKDIAIITDGPFSETKEQLAGFYILDCKNQEEALQLGENLPAARMGKIEVRPLIDYEKLEL